MAREGSSFVKVSKGFMDDLEQYNYREKFLYTMLESLKSITTQRAYVSIDMIVELLGVKVHSKNRMSAKEAIVSMETKELISVYDDILGENQISAEEIKQNGVYAIKVCEIDPSYGKAFTKVEDEYIRKFMRMNEKNKDLLFAVYMNVISYLFEGVSNKKYSYPNISEISKRTGINRKTVMKYIDILKSNEILYYETAKIGDAKDKNLYAKWHNSEEVSNAISRLENGEEIDVVL